MSTSTTAAYDPATLKLELVRDEGTRNTLYKDSMGYETIGIGHNMSIPQNDFTVNALYENDVAGCEASLDLHVPWWRSMDAVRQRVIMNMMFNMGWGGLSSFTNTLVAMEKGLYASAAQGMLNSKWAKQVGARATRLAYMMAHGQTEPGSV